MTAFEFDDLLNDRIKKIIGVLLSKGEDYASASDRLHNFKAAAKMKYESPGRSLLGMLVKHWVSVQDLVERRNNGLDVNHAAIDEKIGDAINYLILLEALLKEKR